MFFLFVCTYIRRYAARSTCVATTTITNGNKDNSTVKNNKIKRRKGPTRGHCMRTSVSFKVGKARYSNLRKDIQTYTHIDSQIYAEFGQTYSYGWVQRDTRYKETDKLSKSLNDLTKSNNKKNAKHIRIQKQKNGKSEI